MPASMETVTGATGGASGGASSEAAGLAPFQVQFIKNMIEDSLEEFKYVSGTSVDAYILLEERAVRT